MMFFFLKRDFLPHKTNKKLFSFEEEADRRQEEDKKKKKQKKNAHHQSEKKWHHRLHLTLTSWQKKPSPPKSEKR